MMTHFLYRSQERAPSEFIKGSRGFRKRLGILVSAQARPLNSPSIAVDYKAAEASPRIDRQFDRRNRARSFRSRVVMTQESLLFSLIAHTQASSIDLIRMVCRMNH